MEFSCVRCGFSISQHSSGWLKRAHFCASTSRDSLSRTNGLASQTSVAWSQRFTESIADSCDLSSQNVESFTNAIRSTCIQVTSTSLSWHMLMTWLSQESQSESLSVQRFFQEIRKTLSLNQAHRLPRSWSSGGVPWQNHQEAKVRSNHRGIFPEVHWQSFWVCFASLFKGHRKWCQDSVDPEKRIKSSVIKKKKRGSFIVQDSSKQNCCGCRNSGMTSSIQSRSCQDLVKSPGIRLRQPQAPSQVCPSSEFSRTHCNWDCQVFRLRLGRMSKSRRSTSGSLIALLSINVASTSQMQASVSNSSTEAELYAVTQAAVESLVIKHFIQDFKSAILSQDVKIIVKTDSSASKTMASRQGISRKSKHIGLKHLWIQAIFSEGVISLEKVRTHHNPSCSRSSLKLLFLVSISRGSTFKDSSLSQVYKYCSSVEKIKTVKLIKEDVSVNAHTILSRANQQACNQNQGQRFSQGQICMLDIDNARSLYLCVASRERVLRAKRL